jgi:hypothetical protein
LAEQRNRYLTHCAELRLALGVRRTIAAYLELGASTAVRAQCRSKPGPCEPAPAAVRSLWVAIIQKSPTGLPNRHTKEHPLSIPATTRRQFLRVGALGGFGLSLPPLLRAEALAKAAGRGESRPKSCIFIFLWGGPSHIDTFDMKPLAPDNIRGEFRPIQTTVPGTHIVEHLPRTARLAEHFSIIRTLHHNKFIHQPAGSYLLTGVEPGAETAAQGAPTADDAPARGALAARLAPTGLGLPPCIMLPARLKGQNTNLKGQTGGWLGSPYDPMVVAQDPNAADFKVEGLAPRDDLSRERLDARRELLHALQPGAGVSDPHRRAFELLSSGQRSAFNLEAEPNRVRDRYGRSTLGQGVLLARRLIEAGCRLVTVSSCRADGDHLWDTHGENFTSLKKRLLPPLDLAYSALLQDLLERGLFDDTVVYLGGEFGRTPRVGQNLGGGAFPDGRDHYPNCFCGVLAGGRTRPGIVYGASDSRASAPDRDPASLPDLTATLFAAMGLDHEAVLTNARDGRPMPATRGTPLAGLLR